MDDEVIILSVETGEAVKSVGELRANITAYKEALESAEIGSKEYNDILIALQTNQAALKNAMHATTTDAEAQAVSMEDVARAATGAGTSYNALVRKMAMLDQEFRATEDVAKRDVLGSQIKNLNEQLKEMDAQRGKFGRNVGNYKSALDGMAGAFKATAGQAGSVIPKVQGVTAGFKAMSATPVIAILGLLANVIGKVISGLDSSEAATNRLNRALSIFKPIADAAQRSIQAIGNAVAKAAEWIAGLAEKWGLLTDEMRNRQFMEEYAQNTTEIERTILKENAKLAQDVAIAREKVQDKEKYTLQERIKFLEQAQWAEKQIAKNNELLATRRLEHLRQEAALTENSKEVNDALVKAEVDLINVQTERATKMRRIQRELNALRKEGHTSTAAAVKEEGDALAEEIERLTGWEEILHTMDEGDKARAAAREAEAKQYAELDALIAESDAALTESIQSELDAQLSAEWDALQEEKRIKGERMALMFDFAAGVADLAGSIAEIYEANGEADEKSAKKAKALRVAESIINTISGAVAAFTGTIKSVPGPVGIALAAVNSAAVLAAGYANVRKIQQQKVGSGGGDGGASIPAIATAPATPASIQQVRTITGATEEQRLNAMAGDQRVYLVYSDVEAAARSQRVKVQETSW